MQQRFLNTLIGFSALTVITLGNPLAVRGEEGTGSWYGSEFSGSPTASGETFNPGELTAAHHSLPFGTRVRVTNLDNGASVVVRVNDRLGHAGRVIDLSEAAANSVGMVGSGIAPVKLEVLGQ
jgi:rare lipoprotein A